MLTLFRFILVFTCVLGLYGRVVFAQDGEEEEELEGGLPVYTVEEIVVIGSREKVPTISTVATKEPVPIRLTPASIGVVNHGLFEHQNGVVLGDALRNVSGVNVQTVFGVTDFFVIRGFDSLSSGLVLTDGVAEPEATFYHLYNVERVEVLKGPGAFLYGGNPLSGSVNLTRKQPVFQNALRATGSYGSFGTTRGTVDARWSDIDRGIAFRFNGIRQSSDNYRDDKDNSIWAVNPGATWRSDRTTLTANLEYVTSDFRSDSGLPVINGALPDVPRTRSYQSPFDLSGQEIYRGRVELRSQLSRNLVLRDELYYTDFSWLSQGTLFNGAYPNAGGSLDLIRSLLLLDDRQKVLGNQFELQCSFSSGGVTHALLAGLELRRWTDAFTLDVGVLPNIDLFAPVETASQPVYILSEQSQEGDTKSMGVAPYVVDRIAFSERIQMFLGGRYDRIDYDDPITSTHRNYSQLSPMAGLVFSPADDLSFYMNAGTAFAPPSSRVVGPRKAEESRQIEVGVKTHLQDDRLRASLAFYHLDKDNIGIPDATGVTVQDGDQRSRGVELEVMMHPAKNWHTFLSYALTDAELTRFAEMVPVITQDGVTFQRVDRSGNQPAFSPRHTLSVWTAVGFDNGFELGAGVQFRTSHFIAEDNQFSVPDVLTFDASGAYVYRGMRFRVNARNLTDRKYETRGFGSASVIPAHPFGVYTACEIDM
ncbi:MAG: TonB-dependent siderophore receptor [Gemmatimonadetes bacterium]|jgi:iron complex outermembrane recepter protein|nr:TonB-dependent siderophore receptor [Gemmatimonadota bacterium]